MNRGVFGTATGMMAQQRAMDVMANNLANASTVGYKADGLAFGDFYERELQVGGRSIGRLGSGATVQAEFTRFAAGRLQKTGNPLDLALTGGKAMFAVQTSAGVRYTRDGQFGLDAQNRLVDRDGNPVLDERGAEILVPADGPVTVAPTGELSQDDRPFATLGVFQGRFQKVGDNRFAGVNVRPIEDAPVVQGALEQANLDPIQAMAQMIQIGRAFEMSQKAIQTEDDTTGKVLEVLR